MCGYFYRLRTWTDTSLTVGIFFIMQFQARREGNKLNMDELGDVILLDKDTQLHSLILHAVS